MTATVENSAITPPAPEAPVIEPVADTGHSGSFGAGLRQFTMSVVSQGSQLLSSGQAAVSSQADNLRQVLSSAGSGVLEKSTQALRFSLRTLATDPAKGPGMIDEIVKLAPVLGTTRMYASAWQKYQHGASINDAEMVNQAKRECLIAVVNAGLDVTTLGMGAIARSGLSAALKVASTARLFMGNSDLQKSLINPIADVILRNSRAQKVVEALLTSLEPASEIQGSAATANTVPESPAKDPDQKL